MSVKKPEPPLPPDPWDATWEGARRHLLRSTLSASPAQRIAWLEEAHRRLFSLRLQRETRQLPNHRELPRVKRLIARVKTIQRERQMVAREGR